MSRKPMTTQDWQDPEVAASWNAKRPFQGLDNPLRAEHLELLISIIQDHYEAGKTILDLGMGNGMVEELLMQRIPHVQVIGVDYSEPMIELAHKRLDSYK